MKIEYYTFLILWITSPQTHLEFITQTDTENIDKIWRRHFYLRFNNEKFLHAELSPRIIMKNMIVEVAKLMYSSENTYKR